MPEFLVEGEAELFETAEDIDVNGEICRYGFVTAERGDGNVVVLTPVELKDLRGFDGLLFQVDVEESAVIRRFKTSHSSALQNQPPCGGYWTEESSCSDRLARGRDQVVGV